LSKFRSNEKLFEFEEKSLENLLCLLKIPIGYNTHKNPFDPKVIEID